MKRLLCLLWIVLPSVVWSQSVPPSWAIDAYRERNYPVREWYTGFVRDRLRAGADVNGALRSLEREALNQLAESIIVTVEGVTRVENTSRQRQTGAYNAETITTDYRQVVRTATTATTVNTEVKSYYDPSEGTLLAFAAVQRSELAAYYRRQITFDLTKVEAAINLSGELAAAGRKINARSTVAEAKQMLADVGSYRSMLVVVDPDANDFDLQTDRTNSLIHTVERLLIELANSTVVFIDCQYEYKGYRDDAFGSDPGIFCDIVMEALNENDCRVTENIGEADYELILVTSTTQRSDGRGQYGIISYYANVKGTLYDLKDNKRIADFSVVNDPDAYAAGRSAEDAATKAFKLPSLKEKVIDLIISKLKY